MRFLGADIIPSEDRQPLLVGNEVGLRGSRSYATSEYHNPSRHVCCTARQSDVMLDAMDVYHSDFGCLGIPESTFGS
jgi:hypothetical protein